MIFMSRRSIGRTGYHWIVLFDTRKYLDILDHILYLVHRQNIQGLLFFFWGGDKVGFDWFEKNSFSKRGFSFIKITLGKVSRNSIQCTVQMIVGSCSLSQMHHLNCLGESVGYHNIIPMHKNVYFTQKRITESTHF